jgi:hypothetical protein
MANSAGFWTSSQVSPKRAFRFLVTIGSMPDGARWYAKSATKPKVTVNTTDHKFLNHTFYYPGNVTWDEVTIEMVDPVSPDASANLSRILFDSGYVPPTDVNSTTTISKKEAVDAVQAVVIEQIDSEGGVIERWTLTNAFITSIDYGGTLKYGEEGLTTVTAKFRFDWASIETFMPGTNGAGANKADPGPGIENPAPGLNKYWGPGQSY